MTEIPPAALGPNDLWSYAILFVGVSASWIGLPIVGGVVLAAAGVLAGDGQLNLGLVIAVAAAGAWTGGYVGYVIGACAGDALTQRPGRWQRQRRRALALGERFYSRWGPLAVLVTPAWVPGVLHMRRQTFLIWNAVAAIGSSVITVFGAYAVAATVLGGLSARPGLLAIVLAAAATAVAGVALRHRHRRHEPADVGSDRPA